MQSYVNFCVSEYSKSTQQTSSFNLSWTDFTTPGALQSIGNSYLYYGNNNQTNLLPYTGSYFWYPNVDGYFFELNENDTITSIRSKMVNLQSTYWIDRFTSAVFAEFATYNPNINLFAYVTILFEFLPTGNVLKSIDINTMSVFDTDVSLSSVRLAFVAYYMILVVFFSLREVKKIIKLKRKYFTRFISYAYWLLFALSWTFLAIYIWSLVVQSQVSRQLTENQRVVNLRYLGNVNDIIRNCLGACVCLATLIFLKFLRFSKTLSYFMFVLKRTFRELAWCMFMIVIVFLSAAQLMYLINYQHSFGYSNFLKSLESCFLVALKHYDSDFLLSTGTFLSPLSFVLVNILVVFIFPNLIRSVLVQSLWRNKKLRQEMVEKSDDTKLVNHLKEVIKSRFGQTNRIAPTGKEPKIDNMVELSLRLNKVSDFLRNVNSLLH
jgi:hypothetical protein